MSQDNNVISFDQNKKQKKNILTDKEKIVFAYHAMEVSNLDEMFKLLTSVSPGYYQTQFHKDISRALLCQSVFKSTQDFNLGKESEFYLIIYRLTKAVTEGKFNFVGSGHFYQLKDELFKGLVTQWR